MPFASPLLARCCLAAVGGACYALAFPPVGGRWLVVPAIAALLLALRGLKSRQALALGFLHGMVASTLSLHWLWLLFGPLALALWAMLAAYIAAFSWMQSRAEMQSSSPGRLAVFAAINWAGWEFIRAELSPLCFPWMTPGLALGPNALLPLIGVYGVGALLVLLAALLSRKVWGYAALVLAVLASAVAMHRKLPEPKAEHPGTLAVAGVQREGASLKELLEASRKAPPSVRHVVWPEYALAYDVHAKPEEWAAIQALCKERDITLTLGTMTPTKDGKNYHNTAVTVDTMGVRGEHDKAHTVHLFNDGEPGMTALPITTTRGAVGTPICFDCDFEGVVRRMTRAGAEFFLVPSMDAASWGAWQHQQHAELFRIRASENARWILVAASSGVSQIIDAHGHVHAKLEAMQEGLLDGRLEREQGITLYTRLGWLFPWLLLVCAAWKWITLLLPAPPAKNTAP